MLDDVAARVTAFVQRCVYYVETRDDGEPTGIRQFKPWPWQLGLLSAWQRGGDHIILKSRQLGLSWLLTVFALWVALFTPGANIIILSINQDIANRLIKRIKVIWEHLPVEVSSAFKVVQYSTSVIEFQTLSGEPRGIIQALPSTESVGRSEATTLVLCDEWAFHAFASENYAAYRQTGGRVIGVSTANGAGGLFWRTFVAAVGSRVGLFRASFVNWQQHPSRDEAWYAGGLADMQASLGPELGTLKMHQEHPRTWQEAFVASGSCVFDTVAIQRMLAEPDVVPIHEELLAGGYWKVWQEPVVGGVYAAGADVAEGLADSDFSGMAIYDVKTGMHAADLHGRWTPNTFAKLCYDFAAQYNWAYLGPERNGPGLAVVLKLEELAYPNLHMDIRTNSRGDKMSMRTGWATTVATKPVMIADMNEMMVTGRLRTYDKAFLSECLTYVRKETPSGLRAVVGATSGNFDDRVVKNMIAVQMWDFAAKSPLRGRSSKPYNVDGPRDRFEKYPEGIRSGTGRVIAERRKLQGQRPYNVEERA